MPTLANSYIPPPKSWDEFESIALDATKIRWGTPSFFSNGRQGQKQKGVDIWGTCKESTKIGIQCKNTIKGITIKLVKEEIALAEDFQPSLKELYIATTASRDAIIQEEVRIISKARMLEGKFSVDLLFWEDISGDLTKDKVIFKRHYPDFNLEIDAKDTQKTESVTEILEDTLRRVGYAARDLIKAARNMMQLSSTVVSLGLEIIQESQQAQHISSNLDEILKHVSSGKNLLLFGEGGIGKTTTALELAQRMLDEDCPRVPIYIDAAVWSSTELSLLDYVASLPPFISQAVTSAQFGHLVSTGKITIIINGWNEIPPLDQERCSLLMKQITGTAPDVNMVLSARSMIDKAGLVSPVKVRVIGVNWAHQKEFIRSQLESEKASVLIDRLAKNKALRTATRNPLVLKGVVQLQLSDIEITQGIFNIFKAIIENYECEGVRNYALRVTPLGGLHSKYLEMLACEMNRKQGTTLSMEHARTELTNFMRQLVDAGQIERLLNPSEILNALCNHHLLFAEVGLVRFAHQRFQEYFVAVHIFDKIRDSINSSVLQDDLLIEAINWPFWEDALLQVAEKLAESSNWIDEKVFLIEAARQVDIGIACKLSSVAKLQRSDCPKLFDSLVSTITQLNQSPIIEVKEYATTCMIDSGLDAFEDFLWPRLESENQQVRLSFHRQGNSSISIQQLGPNAKQRVMKWSPERRAEFVHGIAENPQNAEFIEELAQQDVSDEVRVAAICALGWDFPASEFALNAWKYAPDKVKLNNQVLNLLEDLLLEGGDDVQKEIVRLAESVTDDHSKVRLALLFPDWLGSNSSDALVRELLKVERNDSNERLVTLVQRVAPVQFLEVAKECCLTKSSPPNWARKRILALSSQERFSLFEKFWNSFKSEANKKFSVSVLGACAGKKQIRLLVLEYLRLDQQYRGNEAESSEVRARYDVIRGLLGVVVGDDLLSVVLKLGHKAKYRESEELISLVTRRARFEYNHSEDDILWLPTSDEVDKLIQVFWGKVDSSESPQNRIIAELSSIASNVDAIRFSEKILEGCRTELDTWSEYQKTVDMWALEGCRSSRPSNPMYGNYITSALVRCGFNVLPALLDLIDHPQAHHIVFTTIGQILAKPWSNKLPREFLAPILDGKEAKARRESELVMLQPDPILQDTTDQTAHKLVEKLIADLQLIGADNATVSSGEKSRQIKRPDGDLLIAIAKIPSPECIKPLWDALARDDVNEYTFLDVLCLMVRQGVYINDERVVQRILNQYEKITSAGWLDSSAQFRFNQFNALLYFVRPLTLLVKPLTDYLPKWIQSCHMHEVVRTLKSLFNDESWRSLVFIARDQNTSSPNGEELTYAIVDGLSPSTFEEYLDLLKDGTFFRLQNHIWTMSRIASQVANVINTKAGWRETFITACSVSNSKLADAFVCEVLTASEDGEQDMVSFGLQILDNSHDTVRCSNEMLLRLFTGREPIDNAGAYEIYPRSCNMLRQQLFARAIGTELSADLAKSLLCEIEGRRREGGRPSDEPRHPDINVGLPWSDSFIPNI